MFSRGCHVPQPAVHEGSCCHPGRNDFVPGCFPGAVPEPVAPTRQQVETIVRAAFERYKSDTTGKNADYIPYLAQVDPKLFGVAIVTTDNQVLTLGDVNYSFSIQSISKVFTLALAMEQLGPDKTFQRVRL